MGRNVYLGETVEDIGKPGLDTLKEVRDICDAIIDDCITGRISYKTAMSRMNLLELVIVTDSRFIGERQRKARDIVDRKREELQRECGG